MASPNLPRIAYLDDIEASAQALRSEILQRTASLIDAVASAVGTLDGSISTEIAALNGRLDTLQGDISALKSAPDPIPSLQGQIDGVKSALADLAAKIDAVGQGGNHVPAPDPPLPPPTPTPPPPPSTGTPVARLVVPAAGIVRVGVPVAPGIFKGAPHLVQIGIVVAQADNAVIDRDGWLRWFLLSAIAPAGDHVIAVSDAAGPRSEIPFNPPRTILSIPPLVPGDPPVMVARWRDGPIAIESVSRQTLAISGLVVELHESVWADGSASTTVIIENGLPDARTQSYDCTIARGNDTPVIYTGIVHAPYTRWVRRLGDQPVLANVIPLDGGTTWDHFKAARAIPNYAGDPGTLDMKALDAVPDLPFPPAVNGWIGPFSAEQGAPGDNPDIGVFPIYHLQALRHLDAAGLRMLTRSADLRQGAPYFIRGKAGTFLRPDDGFDYVLDQRWASPKTPLVGKGDGTAANQYWELAHWGSMFYLPYLVTGDLVYLQGQIAQAFVDWACAPAVPPGNDPAPPAPPHPHGSQLNRHGITNRRPRYWDCGDSTFAGHVQERQMGWGVRTTVQTIACLPSDDARVRALLGWDKSVATKLWEGVTDTLHNCYVVGSAERFPPGSYRRIHSQQGAFASWMQGAIWASLAHGCELGVMPPRALEFVRWWFDGLVSAALDPAFRLEWIIDGSFFTTKDRKQNWWNSPAGEGSPCLTPEDVYLASTDPATRVAPGTPRPQVHAADWAGYWGDAFAAAVDLGVPRAAEALAAFRILARRWEGRDWLYSVKHSAVPQGATLQ